MKYYVYELRCQGHVNHVIADENGPPHNCQFTRGEEIDIRRPSQLNGYHLNTKIYHETFVFKGRLYNSVGMLAIAMRTPLNTLLSDLIELRLWLGPYHKDLIEFVDGKPLPRLIFKSGRTGWVLKSDEDSEVTYRGPGFRRVGNP